MYYYQIFLFYLFVTSVKSDQHRPNVLFIVADDLGWNDVGFHGSSQIPTPNIDALAYSGIILNNYYVTPLCSPSRSALMTGKHPIRTGMQLNVLFAGERHGLPLTERLLPEYMRDLGYKTHAVGKWHLGFYKKEYTPTYRGFDSHYGYWTAHHDYNDHTAVEFGMWGLDLHRGLEPAFEDHGKYSTDLFTDEAVRIIENHEKDKPLFLYLAHAAVHSGNEYNPLPVPDQVVTSIKNVSDYYRRRFAGMLTKLDDSVGEVVDALRKKGILENTIIMFTTDNGGAAAGFNLNVASNWPFKGMKSTMWEGGVHGVGLIWSPLLKCSPRVSNQMMHISDWMPTILSAVNAKDSIPDDLDGMDLWDSLSEDIASPRTYVLHNIVDVQRSYGLTVGNWKMMQGTFGNGVLDDWFGPSGRDPGLIYNVTQVVDSYAGRAIAPFSNAFTEKSFLSLRRKAEITCDFSQKSITPCDPNSKPCLFNIKDDPCELNDLSKKYPNILSSLLSDLKKFNKTAIIPGNMPIDLRADPKNWNNVWTNFGDYT